MAKYRHRIFEMYESLDETIQAMVPKSERAVAEVAIPELKDLKHLEVSHAASLTHVQFKDPEALGEEAVSGLRNDFAQLTERLERDSKVMVDFTGLESFSPAGIDALVLLHKQLKNRGSRIALCGLSPAVREAFFAVRSP